MQTLLDFIVEKFGENWREEFFKINEYFQNVDPHHIVSHVTGKIFDGVPQLLQYKPSTFSFIWREKNKRVTVSEFFLEKYNYQIQNENTFLVYFMKGSQKFYPLEIFQTLGPVEIGRESIEI